MTAGEVDFLAGPEAPGADHEKAAHADDGQPDDSDPPGLDGIGSTEVNRGGEQAGGCGDGHADEIFAAGATWVAGLGVVADVESRQARGSADQVEETNEGASVEEVLVEGRTNGIGQVVETPDVGQKAGRDTEGDDVGERIEFLAELACRVGHTGYAPVECVKGNGKKDGDCGPVEVGVGVAAAADGRDGLSDGEVAGSDVADSEQRRQQVHAPA